MDRPPREGAPQPTSAQAARGADASPSPASAASAAASVPTASAPGATAAPGVHPAPQETGSHGPVLGLALAALGVVYGDIGTSPLYALKECFVGTHGVDPTPENVLGVLSLVFWAMTFVVTFKYLTFVMRASNRGEGGILALMALVGQRDVRGARGILLMVGLFGATLLYGDGVITPAISVLGAMDGLAVAAPAFQPLIVPLTVVILILLFMIQSRGTATVGAVFGPVMLVWFLMIAVLGVRGILHDPAVFRALLPTYAVDFFVRNGTTGFLVLAAVVLVITGGEALYADMGHFGRRPIRIAWLGVAMPALLLNYFGQGALLLHDPTVARNPFYLLAPPWFVYPATAVATAAAIVASQALISGAFSLTRQAVQLGYCPRVTIRHTSHSEIGQIYVPEVNWAIAVSCVGLVLGFQTSSNLAAAYGIAVTGTMATTTLLFHRVMRDLWKWSRPRAWTLTTVFMIVDLAFFGANVTKIPDGGWFPLVTAVGIFALLSTWKRGRAELGVQMRQAGLPLQMFLDELGRKPPHRVAGTAIFMTGNVGNVPPVLLHHLKHNRVLHEQVVLVSIQTLEIPSVPEAERLELKDLGHGFFQIIAEYGFMETPDVPALLAAVRARKLAPDLRLEPMQMSYFLGRETLLPGGPSKMARWRKRLFIVMARNAQTASAFFGLPPNRVVELGAQIQL